MIYIAEAMKLDPLISSLPVGSVLPDLDRALATKGVAVLQAPPGAGKTTLVPLYLLNRGQAGKILMLEPRRLAARAAAERLAEHLGQKVGQTIGYRMRGAVKSGPETRIEVVTEGILTRMIQSDPELSGIGLVIFDEFHERSLQADLGLALCLEIRGALREDLNLLVMSATLNAGPVAALLGDAPVITSRGRSFPVETTFAPQSWRGPRHRFDAFERAVADRIATALKETEGGILAFLPGAGEIHRVARLLEGDLPADIRLHKLYGALDFAAQRAAVKPESQGRKLVLATSIAETSLTIADISVVVDSGLARRARFDAASGMARLVTDRVTEAEATQRMGRAGRTSPGRCYKVWTKGENGALQPFPEPEIRSTDLVPLVLEAALWGTTPGALPFLDPPPAAAITAGRELLRQLGALDQNHHVTPHGRALGQLPLHPRLGHMVTLGGKDAPFIAALLSEQDILHLPSNPRDADFTLRIRAAKDARRFERETGLKVHPGRLERVRSDLKRFGKPRSPSPLSMAQTAALAYPDRIGKRRDGTAPRFLLSGGKGAQLPGEDALADQPYLVALDLDGDKSDATIRLAAALSLSELREVFGDQIKSCERVEWSSREGRVLARQTEEFGALVLNAQSWKTAPADKIAAALVDGVRMTGLAALPWSKASQQWRARIDWLIRQGVELPDLSDAALLAGLEEWLLPALKRETRPGDISPAALSNALRTFVPWEMQQRIDKLAPASITAPTGTELTIDYGENAATIRVRLQEMFGLRKHPTIGPKRTNLLIELLSPAGRPVQLTSDLPGFWASSYEDVRKDLRGRYPKHFWPEDPAEAAPTRRVKPRGGK